MKPRGQELVTGDRISTRKELSEVIGLLITQHQLPFEALWSPLHRPRAVPKRKVWTCGLMHMATLGREEKLSRLPTSFLAADTSAIEARNADTVCIRAAQRMEKDTR
jgi:hypothetical protein